MQEHPYFHCDGVKVLAHRGGLDPLENTIEAFQKALSAGANYIETDVRTSKDGVALLFHDEDLIRLTGLKRKIKDLTLEEIKTLELSPGLFIPTLAEAFEKLPNAKFNLDLKDEQSVQSAVKEIELHQAHSRVLVSSFSERRRLSAIKSLSKPVATSTSSALVLKLWLIYVLNLPKSLMSRILKDVGAVQIPVRFRVLRLDSKAFIGFLLSSGTEVHFWSINDPKQMLKLTSLGASGIITDVPELAVQTLRKA